MMKNNPSSRGLLHYPALLSIWLALSITALFYTDDTTAMAGTLILATLSVVSLSVVAGVFVWGISLITILVFGVMMYTLYGLHTSTIVTFITFSTAAVGTSLLAWNTSRQFMSANRQVERDRLLIEEMRVNDEKTGLMRFHYARRTLANEVSRSLRYGKKISVLLMKIDKWEELAEKIGLESRENLLMDICEVLFSNCRSVDTLFINIDKVGAILPETGREGAEVISRRLAEQVKKKTKYALHIGIALFPDDSIIDDDLVSKADIALLEAINNNREIVYYQPEGSGQVECGRETAESENPLEGMELTGYETGNHRQIQEGETAIQFQGASKLGDIESLQKALEKVPDIRHIRLVDFSEEVIIFAVEAEEATLAEHLLTRLDLPNISIDAKDNKITVKLDTPILHKE
ncbi:MAG: diguanylate cyclase [Leptolinea sp.]|jgi:diguanylate cyclase (GGDEF)-like protein|nr:diguanylate cyclase [Leptolinea sp.]